MVKEAEQPKENELIIDTCGIQNLRLYRCVEDNRFYFVNGFAISARTKKTMVLYTDVKLAIIYTRDTKDFTELVNDKPKYTIIEDAK